MKRPLVIALAAVVFTLPMCAQRSVAHGSFSGNSAPAFHGGFTSAPHSFTGAPRYSGNNPFSSTPRLLGSAPRNFASRPSYYNGASRYSRPYRARYGYGVPYLGAAWIAPNYLAYPDTTAYDDSEAPDYAAGYDNSPPDRVPAPPPYPSYTEPQHASPPLANEETVTLIFKDGRPPQQIRNYAMTRTMLYVRDEHHRDIPLDQLNIDATQKVNRDAGVDFQLPEISK